MTLEMIWYFLNSPGMTLDVDPIQFHFQRSPYAVHTLVKKLHAPLDDSVQIIYKVEGRGPFTLVNGTVPTVSLFFQRRGDDWSGQGPYASYRWYRAGGPGTLTLGEHRLEVPLRPEYWTNVWGQHDTPLGSGAPS